MYSIYEICPPFCFLQLIKDSQHNATVQYVDKDFAVISLGDTGHLAVIPTTAHLNETLTFESGKLSVGRSISVTVIEPSSEHLAGRALVDYQLSTKKGKLGMESQNKSDKNNYKIGDFVTMKVKTIKPLCVLLTLPDGRTGTVHISELHKTPKVGGFPTSALKVGTEVKGRVIGAREIHSHK